MMTQFDDDARDVNDRYRSDVETVDQFDGYNSEYEEQVDDNYHIGTPAAPQHAQAKSVNADYYAIVDTEDWPIAGLVVLVDRRRQAVRAELHLYEDGERQNEYALHQAQAIVKHQYQSTDPVQLQVMQSYPYGEVLDIRTAATAPVRSTQTDVMAIFQEYWQYILGAAALIILILFIWLITSFFRSPDTADTQVTDVPAQTVAEQGQTAADSAAPADAAVATTAPVVGEQTNGLAPSINADPNLAIGKRARVQPGITVSLVSEPVPDQSLVVGFWEAGEEGVLIDGPVRKQGNTDTIVWWRVRLDDGTEAWAPANTSEATLLRAVE
ncbi:MAG: hypothetical protein KDE19_13710 [Caldilineaceae bacterium]|nr:hypothetical protein [Caldilineaceae bacterium]